MGRVVLDTSVLIALERNQLEPDQVFSTENEYFVPEIAVAEYLVGVENCNVQEVRQRRLAFLNAVEELATSTPFSRADSAEFARQAAHSKSVGSPREKFDLAIAASAIRLNAVLYTRDKAAKFSELHGLTVKEL